MPADIRKRKDLRLQSEVLRRKSWVTLSAKQRYQIPSPSVNYQPPIKPRAKEKDVGNIHPDFSYESPDKRTSGAFCSAVERFGKHDACNTAIRI